MRREWTPLGDGGTQRTNLEDMSPLIKSSRVPRLLLAVLPPPSDGDYSVLLVNSRRPFCNAPKLKTPLGLKKCSIQRDLASPQRTAVSAEVRSETKQHQSRGGCIMCIIDFIPAPVVGRHAACWSPKAGGSCSISGSYSNRPWIGPPISGLYTNLPPIGSDSSACSRSCKKISSIP